MCFFKYLGWPWQDSRLWQQLNEWSQRSVVHKPPEAWLADCAMVAPALLEQTLNCRNVMEGYSCHVSFKDIQPKGKEGLKSRLCYCTLLTMKPGTDLYLPIAQFAQCHYKQWQTWVEQLVCGKLECLIIKREKLLRNVPCFRMGRARKWFQRDAGVVWGLEKMENLGAVSEPHPQGSYYLLAVIWDF